MSTLLFSVRQTDDAQLLWRACIAAKSEVVRVRGWQVPALPALVVTLFLAIQCKFTFAAEGLSAKHPGDAGIEADPAVLFAENFESGDMKK